MSRPNSQLNLPPSLLSNSEPHGAVLTNREQPDAALPNCAPLTREEAHDLSARLVDEAISAAKLTNAEIAFVLQIDESLIRKMRSPQARERMSHGQMLQVGCAHPRFYVEMILALDDRTGWLRAYALRLQQKASVLFALAVGR